VKEKICLSLFINEFSEKGKLSERVRRKAMGLRFITMIARLPNIYWVKYFKHFTRVQVSERKIHKFIFDNL
jgi:hypothetical protein